MGHMLNFQVGSGHEIHNTVILPGTVLHTAGVTREDRKRLEVKYRMVTYNTGPAVSGCGADT